MFGFHAKQRSHHPCQVSGKIVSAAAGNLLLQGRATGQFTILAADSGKLLWSFDAQTAVMAQPITYLAKGKQYVSVIAGARFATAIGLDREWNYRTQQWRLLTFALDQKAKLPSTEPPIAEDPTFRIDPAKAAARTEMYAQRCAICHGAKTLSGGAAPHLLQSDIPLDRDTFSSVLRDGILQPRGMPGFAELTPEEITSLQHYLRQRAREVLAEQNAGKARASIDGGLHDPGR